jgi:hypothetical protein
MLLVYSSYLKFSSATTYSPCIVVKIKFSLVTNLFIVYNSLFKIFINNNLVACIIDSDQSWQKKKDKAQNLLSKAAVILPKMCRYYHVCQKHWREYYPICKCLCRKLTTSSNLLLKLLKRSSSTNLFHLPINRRPQSKIIKKDLPISESVVILSKLRRCKHL